MVKSLPERDITNVLLLSVEKPVCQAVALAQMDALNEYFLVFILAGVVYSKQTRYISGPDGLI